MMGIQTQIDRLQTAKAELVAQIVSKGVDVPSDASLDDLAALVQAIDTQEDLSAEMKTQDELIEDILTALAGKVAGGGSGAAPVIRALSITKNGTYTPPDGVDGYSPVVVDVPTSETPDSVNQATPVITVSESGLITAKATQEAGYVAAGTRSATKQLPTKGATTVTPGSSVQTVVSAGTYVTGDIKVGAAPGGGGGGGSLETCAVSINNPDYYIFYWTNAAQEFEEYDFVSEQMQIDVVKGSVIVARFGNGVLCTGEVANYLESSDGGDSMAICVVNGPGTITIS